VVRKITTIPSHSFQHSLQNENKHQISGSPNLYYALTII